MAISYIQAKIVGRSFGHNAVQAAAYRSRSKLFDSATGRTFNFDNLANSKQDLIHSNIILPNTAFTEKFTKDSHPFNSREQLWNSIEKIENTHNRKDSAQLAVDFVIALPKELSHQENIELANRFIKETYVDRFNIAADINIHDEGNGNPHAHVMLTFRQLNGIEFSTRKHRNILPSVINMQGRDFVRNDGLNKKYTDFQNRYFKEINKDLVVDQTGIVPTIRMTRDKNNGGFNKEHLEENRKVLQANADIVSQDHNKIIDILSHRQSTFNKADIQSLVYKCTQSKPELYDEVVKKVLTSERLINLGYSTAGRETFTIEANFKNDLKLLSIASELEGRRTLDIRNKDLVEVAKEKTLKDEQFNAIKHITSSGDISCLVGYAGAGKTYTMSALNEVYARNGIKVYGTSISGKAVQGLQDEAGIQSNTIAKMVQDYKSGSDESLPKNNSVLVVDEAGMVGIDDMLTLERIAKERNLKLVLVGDPRQLEAISKGNPFKAILEQSGFATMKSITRQKDERDQKATVWCGQGKLGLAINHYYDKGNIHIQSKEDNHQAIISKYESYLNSNAVSDTLMLAFTRRDVAVLNDKAREVLLKKGFVTEGINIGINSSNSKSKTLMITDQKSFSVGDRIIFTSGGYVENGEAVKTSLFADIKSIKENVITVITNENNPREVSFDVTKFNNFDYGYAATVHKSQGATVKNVINYVSNNNWDSHLSYVAMSRHKLNMDMYVDNTVYKDKDQLIRGLSSKSSKEFNALDFVQKRESNKIMDTIRRYMGGESNDYEIKSSHDNRELSLVAELADLNKEIGRDYWKLLGNDSELSDDNRAILEQKQSFRDELAFEVSKNLDKYQEAIELNALDNVDVLKWSQNHVATIQFERFISSNNNLYKGHVANGISDTQRGRVLLSKNNLWNEYNVAVSAYKIHDLIKNEKVSRADVKLVERYLAGRELSYKYYKKTQAEFYGKNIKEFEQLSAKYQKLANDVNKRGDVLAAKIHADIDRFKQIIEAKYSGKMFDNVLGSIERQSRYQELREDVSKYIHAKGVTREQFAYKIATNGKEYARFVAESNVSWKNINEDSKRLRLEAWRSNLGDNLKPVFDVVHQYKLINTQLAQELSINSFENRTRDDKEFIGKLSQERNALATELLFKQGLISYRKDDKFLDKLYPGGIDTEKLYKQYQMHKDSLIAKQTVERYIDNPNNNELAYNITSKFALHAKHVNEAKLDVNELYKQSRYHQLELANRQFNGVDRQIHREISNYIIAKEQASGVWREIKQSGDDSLRLKAQYLSQSRNELAYNISKSLGQNISSQAYVAFTDKQIDLQRILKEAREHELTVKLQEYKKLEPLSQESMKLAKELSVNYSKGAVYYTIKQQEVDSRAFYGDIKAFDKEAQTNKEFVKANATFELYKDAQRANLEDLKGSFAQEILSNKANLKHLERAGLDYNKLNIDALEYRLANYTPSKDARAVERIDYKKIDEEFKKDLNNYSCIFGSKSKETAKTISFGDVTVSKVGKNAGMWWDKTQERYRNPTDAALVKYGVRNKELDMNYGEIAAVYAGMNTKDIKIREIIDPKRNELQFALDEFKEKYQKQEITQYLWNQTENLQGTIADKYLKEHRGITDTSSLAMRYLPAGKEIKFINQDNKIELKTNKIPMLVVGGYNHKGDIVSAQRIYLDEKTAGKNQFMENPKLSMGLVSGAGGLVQKGTSDRVYIVEGPETGASIALADKEASVYCSFGLSNLSKLDKLIKANNFKEVILAADNDGKGSNAERLTLEAKAELERKGVELKVIEPKALNGLAKTDWNDVLKEKGVEEIQKQLGIKSLELTNSREYKQAEVLLDKIVDNARKIEKLGKKAKVMDRPIIFNKLSDEDKKSVKFAYKAIEIYKKERAKLLTEFNKDKLSMPEIIKDTDKYKEVERISYALPVEQQRVKDRSKSRSIEM
ncbi:AAA family ATPase [Francisella philomiragia]|uniref:AAA family ATPase n=1 Tax=Francisella philomiragia TaxID=28110 RepID=UPI001905DABE|nr:AAA family ATPase [Francisella philomiragia]MBK2270193.1 AAA family ATPase [Francisella philomiragia]MBK2275857.1 AAA family ATPase [Francisella philomiragia]MBK2305070.1 AAA family ATPase [Francisella philomiragia]